MDLNEFEIDLTGDEVNRAILHKLETEILKRKIRVICEENKTNYRILRFEDGLELYIGRDILGDSIIRKLTEERDVVFSGQETFYDMYGARGDKTKALTIQKKYAVFRG